MQKVLATAATTLSLLFLWGLPEAAYADGCLPSLRKVKFPDGSAKLQSYVCTFGKSKKPQIRVEFYQLSVSGAGNLVHGTPYLDLERTFGTPRLVDNAVGAETRRLFDAFGSKSERESCYTIEIASAGQPEPFFASEGYTSEEDQCRVRRTVWHLDLEGGVSLPLEADESYILDKPDWPAGYQFFYTEGGLCSEGNPIECTTLWRNAAPADIENYDARYQAYLDRVNAKYGLEIEAQESAEDRPKLALIDHLMRGRWVDDFLLVTGGVGVCGEEPEILFSIGTRTLALDVAIVTNTSNAKLTVDGLIGTLIEDRGLRPKIDSPGTEAQMEQAGQTLQPGESIMVPLRILFPFEDAVFNDTKASDRIYRWIKKAPAQKLFSMSEEAGGGKPQKLAKSFAAPTVPPKIVYVYGPEFILKGIGVDGHTIDFARAARNFISLSDQPEIGSCPYLYAWDDRGDVWVHMGKVIDTANGKTKEATERRAFDGFRSKFRLAEEELEVSYIDQVKLDVELHDGSFMRLHPDFERLAAQDGRYVTIKAGDRIEFEFALPAHVGPDDVKQSTLAITGYYRRYSDLLMARQ
jgi:hypothetical protein